LADPDPSIVADSCLSRSRFAPEWSSQNSSGRHHGERVAAHGAALLAWRDLGCATSAFALLIVIGHGLMLKRHAVLRVIVAGHGFCSAPIMPNDASQSRAACSVFSAASFSQIRGFEKLGVAPSVELVCLFPDELPSVFETGADFLLGRCTRPDLEEHQTPRNGAPGGPAPYHLCPSHRHVYSYTFWRRAGDLFLFDFCAHASAVARAEPLKRRGLDWRSLWSSVFDVRDWGAKAWPTSATW